MASYKVTYFNITALGEPIRMLLSYGGIPFEDERIEREQWPTLKSNQPFGQLPILLNKSNGKVAHQSLAICRYLAKQVKLVGNDDWENLEIDAAADTFNDLRMKIGQYAYEQDEAIKEAKKKPLFAETIPYYLERIDKAVQANNGYMAVGRLTWADIYYVSLYDYICFMTKEDIFAKYPNLVALRKKVLEVPNIKKWVESRPKTEM